MAYWKAKDNLKFMTEFRTTVKNFWNIEDVLEANQSSAYIEYVFSNNELQANRQAVGKAVEDYPQLREQVAKCIKRATITAHYQRTPYEVDSLPELAVGGPIIPVNLFEALLNDTSHRGIKRQYILDAINQAVGACEEQVKVERRHLYNPGYWLYAAFLFFIRIPFKLIELSGFDVRKVEDRFIAKVFKLFEIAAIIYILYRLGMTNEQFRDLLTRLFPK